MSSEACAVVPTKEVELAHVVSVVSRKSKAARSAAANRQHEIDELVLVHRDNGRKLARSLLRRWRARMNIEEVDSIVDLTLCEAAQRYSASHGASFMTFFFYHLRGYLVRAVASAVNSNHVLIGFSPRGANDISEWASSSDDVFKTYLPECSAFGGQDSEGPENLLLRKENIQACRSACSQLDELEQEVLIRSYANEEPLVDIAKSLGYSRCHISRVKKRAIERLETILGISLQQEQVRLSTGDGLAARSGATSRRLVKRRHRRRSGRSNSHIETREKHHA